MTKKKSLIDRLRDAFKTKDEAGFNAGLVELSGVPAADEEEVTAESIEKANEEPKMDDDPMKGWSEKFDALCARMDKFEAGGMAGAKGKDEEPAKEEKKEGECDEDLSGKNPDGVKGDEDPDMKEKEKSEKEEATSSNDHYVSMDAAAFRSEFQATLAKAEVLAPGIKLPMFDTRASTDKASRKTLADKMCGLRRDAVKKALDGKHKEAIKAVVGDRDVAKMSCDSVSMLFDAAAIVAKAANNTARVAFDHTVFKQGPVTAATLQEINEAARKARK